MIKVAKVKCERDNIYHTEGVRIGKLHLLYVRYFTFVVDTVNKEKSKIQISICIPHTSPMLESRSVYLERIQ